jgi:hypothetical protein
MQYWINMIFRSDRRSHVLQYRILSVFFVSIRSAGMDRSFRNKILGDLKFYTPFLSQVQPQLTDFGSVLRNG